MATLYITEFTMEGMDALGRIVPVARAPAVAEQTLTIGAGSVQSVMLNPNTTIVRVHSDTVCSIAIGTSPTATAASMRLPTDAIEYFCVQFNSGCKIAVIANS